MFRWKYNRIATCSIPVWLILLYFLVSFTEIYSQVNFPVGSRAAALSNAVVMDSDIWSVFHNQAGLGDYHNFSIGFHHENKYVVKEFALHALALTVPVKPGTFGFSYTYFGFPKYNESKIGLAFGKSLGEKFSAGIKMNYHYVYIEAEEQRHALTVEGGIQYQPIDAIRIGIHVFNPTRSHLSPVFSDTITTTLRTGISYTPVEKLHMAVEAEKSLNYPFRLKSGIEYEIIQGITLRTGIITHPVQNSFGIGFEIRKISADVAFSHNAILGLTPHFSIQFRLK